MYAHPSVQIPVQPNSDDRLARLREHLADIDAKIVSAQIWIRHFDPTTLVLTSTGSFTVEALLEKLRIERVQCAKTLVTIEQNTACDEYRAEPLLQNQPDDFDAIEIHGVRCVDWDADAGKRIIEVDEDAPEFWSVYLHRIEGGLVCVADVSTECKARAYAKHLSRTYGLRFD